MAAVGVCSVLPPHDGVRTSAPCNTPARPLSCESDSDDPERAGLFDPYLIQSPV